MPVTWARVAAPVIIAIAVLLTAAPAHAQAQPAPPKEQPSTYDRIWTDFTVVRTTTTRRSSRCSLPGGFITISPPSRPTRATRRIEHPARAVRTAVTFLRKFLFHAEVEVNPQEQDPFYMRFTDAYVQWNHSTQFAVTVGKHAAPFTQEGATSSRELITIDRSIIGQNIWFPQEYARRERVGASGALELPRRPVQFGRDEPRCGEFSGDYFMLGVLGYDFAKKLSVKEAVLTGTICISTLIRTIRSPVSWNTSSRLASSRSHEVGRARGPLECAGYLGSRTCGRRW